MYNSNPCAVKTNTLFNGNLSPTVSGVVADM